VRESVIIAENAHADKAGGGEDDVRELHVALNIVTVPIKENFSVGLGSAPNPGHWSLPASERANCRCTTIGAFAE